MEPGSFKIIEHEVPCQHIREYPAATLDRQEDVLHLCVKQYIPRDNLDPQPGDVTILAAHANGIPKELYEPLWEEILCHSKAHGFHIRAIWISDVAHQGQSAVINENQLGNDPSWFDHSRDLLNLVNIKGSEMPPPIVGFGHSMGASQLVHLSLMHPPLFQTLALLEPVLQRPNTRMQNDDIFTHDRLIFSHTQLATYRRDLWPSREAAASSFSHNPFYKAWDKRVLRNWIKYGLRDSSSPGTSSENITVTLTTPRHKEATSFARPYYNKSTAAGSHPDLDPALITSFPFYLPAPSQLFAQLPHVRPSVLYMFARKSPLCLPALCDDKIRQTGTGAGGNGGVAAERVGSAYLEGIGHLAAQEAPKECAEQAASWIGSEIERWRKGKIGADLRRGKEDPVTNVAQERPLPDISKSGTHANSFARVKSKF